MTRQLCSASLDDRSAWPRHIWSAARLALHHGPERRTGLYCQRARHPWYHRDRGPEHVPVPDAVEYRPDGELDRLGCIVEPAHAVRDAVGDADLPACRTRL